MISSVLSGRQHYVEDPILSCTPYNLSAKWEFQGREVNVQLYSLVINGLKDSRHHFEIFVSRFLVWKSVLVAPYSWSIGDLPVLIGSLDILLCILRMYVSFILLFYTFNCILVSVIKKNLYFLEWNTCYDSHEECL